MIIFGNVKISISFGEFVGYWSLVYLCTELLIFLSYEKEYIILFIYGCNSLLGGGNSHLL